MKKKKKKKKKAVKFLVPRFIEKTRKIDLGNKEHNDDDDDDDDDDEFE